MVLLTSLLTVVTGISLHVAMASDFSVTWQFSGLERLFLL
jgi:hypothetical protein